MLEEVYVEVSIRVDTETNWITNITNFESRRDGLSCGIYVASTILKCCGREPTDKGIHLEKHCLEVIERVRNLLVDNYVSSVLELQEMEAFKGSIFNDVDVIRLMKGSSIRSSGTLGST